MSKHRRKPPVLLREEERPAIGRVAVYSNGNTKILRPTRLYQRCSRLINVIFRENKKIFRPRAADFIA